MNPCLTLPPNIVHQHAPCNSSDDLLVVPKNIDLVSDGFSSSSKETLVESSIGQPIHRLLGDIETSYYLPSRGKGVNDMYLHMGFRAPYSLVHQSRVRFVWTILRVRHPLLASRVEMHSYEDIRFVYDCPDTSDDAIDDANASLKYCSEAPNDLMEAFLNGPRILSDECPSYLTISHVEISRDHVKSDNEEFNLSIYIAHYIGDGLMIHQLAQEFFSLLGGTLDDNQLSLLVQDEWSRYCSEKTRESDERTLPMSLENRLPSPPDAKLHNAISIVDYEISQRRYVGGHSFPRRSGLPRRTMTPKISFEPERTKHILSKCKAQGVSVSSALFAVCNIAWSKTHNSNWEMPMMMYSALNLRPYLQANKSLNESYFSLAIGYFNIVLPSFLPKEDCLEATFWHRARSAKMQATKIIRHPMLLSRTHQMVKERGERARLWGMQDDGVEQAHTPRPVTSIFATDPPKHPSNALLGLSLMGNLDSIYKYQDFPSIELHTIDSGTRQRSGGMLLLGYTFINKLWITFGYDVNGFDEVTVQTFWGNVLHCMDQFFDR